MYRHWSVVNGYGMLRLNLNSWYFCGCGVDERANISMWLNLMNCEQYEFMHNIVRMPTSTNKNIIIKIIRKTSMIYNSRNDIHECIMLFHYMLANNLIKTWNIWNDGVLKNKNTNNCGILLFSKFVCNKKLPINQKKM